MARLSPQGANTITQAIEELRKELDRAQLERELEPRHELDLALADLEALKVRLPEELGGQAAHARWKDLPNAEAVQLSNELREVRLRLVGLLEFDGPSAPPHHVMRRAYASTLVVVGLLIVAFSGTTWTLSEIIERWPAATGDVPTREARTASPSARESVQGRALERPSNQPESAAVPMPSSSAPKQAGEDSGAALPNASAPPASARARLPKPTAPTRATLASVSDATVAAPSSSAQLPGVIAANPPTPGASASAGSPRAIADNAKKTVDELEVLAGTKAPISERDVLLMITLMGLLGGFVHLTSSMVKYVGNRALLRSWIPYYMLMPVTGAALAPMTYLLLRVGVLNAGANGQGATANLNVFGLYAFAALTGLFAEQALEMLKDIFRRIFGRVEGKDAIEDKAKAPGV
jgi:hypothetical protein